jgi:hypothetical protein
MASFPVPAANTASGPTTGSVPLISSGKKNLSLFVAIRNKLYEFTLNLNGTGIQSFVFPRNQIIEEDSYVDVVIKQ